MYSVLSQELRTFRLEFGVAFPQSRNFSGLLEYHVVAYQSWQLDLGPEVHQTEKEAYHHPIEFVHIACFFDVGSFRRLLI